MPTLTPKSDAGEQDLEAFIENIRERYQKGKRVYGDASFDRPVVELITEIQQELEDVAGWSAIVWSQLEGLRRKLERIR